MGIFAGKMKGSKLGSSDGSEGGREWKAGSLVSKLTSIPSLLSGQDLVLANVASRAGPGGPPLDLLAPVPSSGFGSGGASR